MSSVEVTICQRNSNEILTPPSNGNLLYIKKYRRTSSSLVSVAAGSPAGISSLMSVDI
jgi:hypothetical protein